MTGPVDTMKLARNFKNRLEKDKLIGKHVFAFSMHVLMVVVRKES